MIVFRITIGEADLFQHYMRIITKMNLFVNYFKLSPLNNATKIWIFIINKSVYFWKGTEPT